MFGGRSHAPNETHCFAVIVQHGHCETVLALGTKEASGTQASPIQAGTATQWSHNSSRDTAQNNPDIESGSGSGSWPIHYLIL